MSLRFHFRRKKISLYTYAFADALKRASILNNGIIELDYLASSVRYEVRYLSTTYDLHVQRPVYKNNIPGLLPFERKEIEAKPACSYETSDYEIVEITDISNITESRYAAKVLLFKLTDYDGISSLSGDVLQHVISKFKWKQLGKPDVRFISMYWGYDEVDVAHANWAFISSWSNGSKTQSPASNGGVWVNSILVKECTDYQSNRERIFRNTATNKDLIEDTHAIMNEMIRDAEAVCQEFQKYETGIETEEVFVSYCKSYFDRICRNYLKSTDLVIPTPELKKWADAFECLAGTIHDMSLHYGEKSIRDNSESNRKVLMELTVKRFKEDLTRIAEIEAVDAND